MIKIIKISAASALILLFSFMGWFLWRYQFQSIRSSGEVLHEISAGQSAETIARNLQEKKIIKDRFSFLLGYRLFYSGQSLKAGEYLFRFPLTGREVLKKIIAGDVRLHSITIPEGLTRYETADILGSLHFLNRQDLLEASENIRLIADWDPDALDLEGYLFPETYKVPKKITPPKMIETMVNHFKHVFIQEWHLRRKKFNMTVREVVTLASLIEEETSLPEEKPLVSAVFHNRLRRGMNLACDPTIIYALKTRNEFSGTLTTTNLKLDSPYNTYLYPGLPPGPIASPGKSSLHAALYPADVNYLYFVSRNDGSHKFSETYREHVNAVNKYQRRIP